MHTSRENYPRTVNAIDKRSNCYSESCKVSEIGELFMEKVFNEEASKNDTIKRQGVVKKKEAL